MRPEVQVRMSKLNTTATPKMLRNFPCGRQEHVELFIYKPSHVNIVFSALFERVRKYGRNATL